VVAALIPAFFRRAAGNPGHERTSSVFLRAFCALYAFAFAALALQSKALIGDGGLSPATESLSKARETFGGLAPLHAPSLFWLGTSDGELTAAALLGLGLGPLGVAGYASAPLLAALFALYLSFVHASDTFFQEPPDFLLLEAGFLAIFLAGPAKAARGAPSQAPLPVLWLLRWLLFRVFVGAGIARLRGDPCWGSVECLPGYLETETTPTLFTYLAHALPGALQRAAGCALLVVDLVVPFGLFAPRRVRHVAAATLMVASGVGLMVDARFSHWITLVLAVACFDDAALARFIPGGRASRGGAPPSPIRLIALSGLVVLVAGLNVVRFRDLWGQPPTAPVSIEPFHIVNAYETLASVETQRLEIVFEGTDDDVAREPGRFREYELACKPGDPERAPCLPSPYFRRIDQRLSRAAFVDFRREAWTVRLLDALLRGDHARTSVFTGDPFQGRPPRFVRARLYTYRFTRRGEPGYWAREPLDDYLRPFSLADPALKEFLAQRGWLPK
jgi:hypothetical protein